MIWINYEKNQVDISDHRRQWFDFIKMERRYIIRNVLVVEMWGIRACALKKRRRIGRHMRLCGNIYILKWSDRKLFNPLPLMVKGGRASWYIWTSKKLKICTNILSVCLFGYLGLKFPLAYSNFPRFARKIASPPAGNLRPRYPHKQSLSRY